MGTPLHEEFLNELNRNISSDLSISVKKKINIRLENIRDLMRLPLKCLLDHNMDLNMEGELFNRVIRDIVEPLEAKKIFKIDPTSKWIIPTISSITFKVRAYTQFGDFVMITGSSRHIGNWEIHHKLNFSEGMWMKELVDQRNSADSIKNLPDLSMEYFGTGSAESFPQLNLNTQSDFEDLNFEFKFIMSQNGNLIWESISNRRFSAKENLVLIEKAINISDDSKLNNEFISYSQDSIDYVYNMCTKSLTIHCFFNK